jgi:hypothetical protein
MLSMLYLLALGEVRREGEEGGGKGGRKEEGEGGRKGGEDWKIRAFGPTP